MIKLLTHDKIPEFCSFCENKISGAVIYTRLSAYGTNQSDVMFWYQLKDEIITAVMSMQDGIFLVCNGENADAAETEMFAKTLGAKQITYGNAKYILRFKGKKKACNAQNITGENIKNAFDVIFEDDENRQKYFSLWYTDASHKIRHNIIHGKCVYDENDVVSVALTSGETEKIAVISSVATLQNHRKKGYGERVVLSLATELQKDVYLLTDSEITRDWYVKMGFEKI